jgi:ABC-type antimicrobial peptide transport system permease subunit
VALVGVGLALGAALALLAGQFAQSLLFGLNPFNARLAALACGLLVLVAAAASYPPARRAMSVDPVEALRKE